MTYRLVLRLTLVAFLIVASLPALAAEYNDDFAKGIDNTIWELASNQPRFRVDESHGKVCFGKPLGGRGMGLERMSISFNCEVVGNFEVSVGFSEAEIDLVELVDGVCCNQIQLEATFGSQSFIVVRSDEDGLGHQAHVWLDPPHAFVGVTPTPDPSGVLRIAREGSTVSAYLDEVTLYEGDFNSEPLTTLMLALQNNDSIDDVSVCFDDFSVTADQIICDDPAHGLVAFYPFNGNAEDQSGSGNHGVPHGVTVTEDRFGNADSAYSFDGAGDFIRVPRSDSLDISGSLSMAAWVHPNAIDDLTAIIDKEENSAGYNIHLTDSQQLQVRVDHATVYAGTVSTQQWHHLSAVYDGLWVRAFVDGIEVGGQAMENLPTATASKDLYIGSWFEERFFDGIIDDVRIYNRSLSKREIDALYLEGERIAVPAVARIQGAGAFFTSKWDFLNLSSGDIVVNMTYTPRRDVGGEAQTSQHVIPGRGLQEIIDPLNEIFDITDDAVGSVVMEVAQGFPQDLIVQSVVFARQDDGREFGQFFPAQRIADALEARERAFITTTEDPIHNRVNFGVMATRNGTSVKVSPVGPIGHVLGSSKRFNLDSGQSRQLNDIHGAFEIDGMADVLLEVEVLDGAALVYGSVVDGKGEYAGTSDPTTIQPVSQGAFEVTLLELGSVMGYDEFSGSASITNHSTNPAEVTVDFVDRSSPGVAASQTLTLAGGETLGYGDLVGDLIGMENAVGTVILRSDNATLLSATGREFAIFRNGESDITGTAGQLIEGLTADDLLHPDKTYHFIGLRQVEAGDSLERSHIAFFNPGDSRVDVTMKLYNDAGALEGEWTRRVRPLELVHVNNIVSKINPSQNGGVKRLEVTTTGPVHSRAFRVNTTGDPITIEPFRR